MKIRTKEDLVVLDEKIKRELGIDVRKYENKEVVEKMVNLLVFPEYVLTWLLRPIGLALFAFVLGYFIIDLVHIEYLVYSIIGAGLFLLTGILAGFYLLTSRMKTDLSSIMDYSISMTKSAIIDMNLVNKQIAPEQKKSAFRLLFKGILHLVTLPMLSQVISEKIPIIGFIINRFVKKIIIFISDRINYDDLQIGTLSASPLSSQPIAALEKSMNFANSGANKTLNLAFGIARFPIKLILWTSGVLLILFLYLIY